MTISAYARLTMQQQNKLNAFFLAQQVCNGTAITTPCKSKIPYHQSPRYWLGLSSKDEVENFTSIGEKIQTEMDETQQSTMHAFIANMQTHALPVSEALNKINCKTLEIFNAA